MTNTKYVVKGATGYLGRPFMGDLTMTASLALALCFRDLAEAEQAAKVHGGTVEVSNPAAFDWIK